MFTDTVRPPRTVYRLAWLASLGFLAACVDDDPDILEIVRLPLNLSGKAEAGTALSVV